MPLFSIEDVRKLVMIPKIIHYCWFGGGEKPLEVQRYIDGWKTCFPDYEIMEWNESNFDVSTLRYTSQAYEMGKFAFVSDYVRLYALHKRGGVYFDTDVEVLRGFSGDMDNLSMLVGFETDARLMTAFIAAAPYNPMIYEMLRYYQGRDFCDNDGHCDTTPNTILFTKVANSFGLNCNGRPQEFGPDGLYRAAPWDYYSAFDMARQRIEPSDNTRSIHHCAGSWQNWTDKILPTIKAIVVLAIGEERFDKMKLLLGYHGR